MADFIIYHVSHPETGDIVYIGVTENLEQRACGHCNAKTDTGNWIRKMVKQGYKPLFTAIEVVKNTYVQKANIREKELIKQYRDLGHVLFNKPTGLAKKQAIFTIINNIEENK